VTVEEAREALEYWQGPIAVHGRDPDAFLRHVAAFEQAVREEASAPLRDEIARLWVNINDLRSQREEAFERMDALAVKVRTAEARVAELEAEADAAYERGFSAASAALRPSLEARPYIQRVAALEAALERLLHGSREGEQFVEGIKGIVDRAENYWAGGERDALNGIAHRLRALLEPAAAPKGSE